MSGTLQASVVKDSASATNNLALDTSGNVTVGNNLTVTGTSTFTGSLGNVTTGTINSGDITSSGTVTAATGTLYPIVSGTSQASTSGTSIDFTGIPSWAKRITVMFNGVSTNGTSNPQIQIGAGSVDATGYSGLAWNNAAGAVGMSSTGFSFSSANASATLYGLATLTLLGSNLWVLSACISSAGTTTAFTTNGSKTLSGALDRVRITTVNGTDTFDAGSINIQYE